MVCTTVLKKVKVLAESSKSDRQVNIKNASTYSETLQMGKHRNIELSFSRNHSTELLQAQSGQQLAP